MKVRTNFLEDVQGFVQKQEVKETAENGVKAIYKDQALCYDLSVEFVGR